MGTKINWKVRFKNKAWLSMFLSLIIGFIFNIMSLFDIYPEFSRNQITEIVSEVLTFLGLVGVLVDPTTAGLGDSERAMSYNDPWVDPIDGGEQDPEIQPEEEDKEPEENKEEEKDPNE